MAVFRSRNLQTGKGQVCNPVMPLGLESVELKVTRMKRAMYGMAAWWRHAGREGSTMSSEFVDGIASWLVITSCPVFHLLIQ